MVYVGFCTEKGVVVPGSEAFEYAMERCKTNEQDKAEFEREFAEEKNDPNFEQNHGERFVEWFFSGNFVKERFSDND